MFPDLHLHFALFLTLCTSEFDDYNKKVAQNMDFMEEKRLTEIIWNRKYLEQHRTF